MWAKTQAATAVKEVGAELKRAATPPKAARREKSGVLQWQTLLCAVLLLGLLLLRALGLPVYTRLCRQFSQLLQQSESFETEEQLVRFASKAVQTLREHWQDEQEAGKEETPPQTAAPQAVAAMAQAGQAQAPPGYRLERGEPTQETRPPLSAYTITSGYGWRQDPVDAGEEFHSGVDMAAAAGTLIYPAMQGMVLQTAEGAEYGHYIKLLHSGGAVTLYAHLEYIFVRAGQLVGFDTALGTVGSTGNATGPHLHLELLLEGVRYDPGALLGA